MLKQTHAKQKYVCVLLVILPLCFIAWLFFPAMTGPYPSVTEIPRAPFTDKEALVAVLERNGFICRENSPAGPKSMCNFILRYPLQPKIDKCHRAYEEAQRDIESWRGHFRSYSSEADKEKMARDQNTVSSCEPFLRRHQALRPDPHIILRGTSPYSVEFKISSEESSFAHFVLSFLTTDVNQDQLNELIQTGGALVMNDVYVTVEKTSETDAYGSSELYITYTKAHTLTKSTATYRGSDFIDTSDILLDGISIVGPGFLVPITQDPTGRWHFFLAGEDTLNTTYLDDNYSRDVQRSPPDSPHSIRVIDIVTGGLDTISVANQEHQIFGNFDCPQKTPVRFNTEQNTVTFPVYRSQDDKKICDGISPETTSSYELIPIPLP